MTLQHSWNSWNLVTDKNKRIRAAMTPFNKSGIGIQMPEHSSHDQDAVVTEWDVKWTKALIRLVSSNINLFIPWQYFKSQATKCHNQYCCALANYATVSRCWFGIVDTWLAYININIHKYLWPHIHQCIVQLGNLLFALAVGDRICCLATKNIIFWMSNNYVFEWFVFMVTDTLLQ